MSLFRVTRTIDGVVEDLTVEASSGPEASRIADEYKADAEANRRQRDRRAGDRRRRERRR